MGGGTAVHLRRHATVVHHGFRAGRRVRRHRGGARVGGSRVLAFVAEGYGTVFRWHSDLLTIYLLYFGGSMALTQRSRTCWAPKVSSAFRPLLTGTLAIGVISGAYQAEVYRGAYLAVDQGQAEGQPTPTPACRNT